jgi:hypothetical protein
LDHLAPASDLPVAAKECLRVWDVNGDARSVRHVSRWPAWEPIDLGYALAAVAADFLHAREAAHRDVERLKDQSDELRIGFAGGLLRAHAAHDPPRYDDWGAPFKSRFSAAGTGANSILAKDYPELFKRVSDDETAIVYYPKVREFGIPVLDGGPSFIMISHDPFSGKALPKPLGDEWFAAVEKLLGRPYVHGDTGVPAEFESESWWIARKL